MGLNFPRVQCKLAAGEAPRWPTPSKVEMPELPWQMVEKGIERLREEDCESGYIV